MKSAVKIASMVGCAALVGLAGALSTPAEAQSGRNAGSNAGAGNAVVRMLSHGSDGEERFYHVRCRDRSEGNVTVTIKTNQICALAVGGQQRCSATWTLREAGQHVCSGR